MLNINKWMKAKLLIYSIFTILIFATACSDDNPVDSSGNTAKVEGRISSTNGAANSLAKTDYSSESVEGAVVVLAKVEANGSLRTVSNNSVQTDASGKFVIETELSGEDNLVVVANKGTTEWKAIVSGTVKSGTTIYAPPLNSESTTEADLYVKLVSEGRADKIDVTNLKILVNSECAAYIKNDADAEAKIVAALNAQYDASVEAMSNSYFGLTASQIQAMANAEAEAKAKFDADLYFNSSDSEQEVEEDIRHYEETSASIYASNNIKANVYAKIMRIAGTAFLNATASMDANVRLAISKSFYLRYSNVLNFAMKQEFSACGASQSEINSVNSANSTLYASIKSSSDMNQINSAFVEYHSSIKSQLKALLSVHASLIETVDTEINSSGSAKAQLNISIAGIISLNNIVDAYISFYDMVETEAETNLSVVTSTQVEAASQILILANMN